MKRISVLMALALVASLLQGCWNYKEVDSFLIVAGVAVDKGYEGYRYHVTIDIADTSSAGKDKPVVSTLVESEGDTISEAVNNSIKMVGMQLYWQNCQIAVISQDVATDTILPVVDWLNRSLEPRLTIELFISQEKTARELLQQQSATLSITSFEIDKYYELNEKVQPMAEYRELYDIYNQLADPGKSLLLPALRVMDNDGDKVCALNGMAVLNRDKLIGFLTPEDSKSVMFVTNHVKGGSMDVKAPTGNTIASLQIYGNNAKITSSVENGKPKFIIETSTDASLDEDDTITDFADKEHRGEFEFTAESQLAAEIGKTVQIAQTQLGVDVFGFGDVLHRQNPGAWYQLQQNWNEAFKTASVQISCNIKIRSSAEGRGAVKKGG